MNRILIATDGSDGAWPAVEDGLALASEVGAAAVFVTVRHDTPLLGDPHYQRNLTAQLERARKILDRAEEEAQRVGVEYESDILEGDAVTNLETRMSTGELRVTLPCSLSEEEAKLLLAVKLYEVGKVSLGQAAKLAGFSKRTFMEMLGRYHVPVFDYSPDDLRQEIDL